MSNKNKSEAKTDDYEAELTQLRKVCDELAMYPNGHRASCATGYSPLNNCDCGLDKAWAEHSTLPHVMQKKGNKQ